MVRSSLYLSGEPELVARNGSLCPQSLLKTDKQRVLSQASRYENTVLLYICTFFIIMFMLDTIRYDTIRYDKIKSLKLEEDYTEEEIFFPFLMI